MKRGFSILVVMLMLTSIVSAAVPYTASLEIVNLRIKSVECSDYNLRVLVESMTSRNVNVLLKVVTNKASVEELSNQEVLSYETSYINVDTDFKCSEIRYVDAKAYLILDGETVLFNNLQPFYRMTGSEPLVQESSLVEIPIDEPTGGSISEYSERNSNMYLGTKLLVSFDLSNNNERYYSQDNLGSNVIVTDNAGSLIEKQEFSPFGAKLNFGSSKYRYTGKELDDNGFNYYGARYYDSSIGRFISIDPVADYSETPYAYVSNNPINYIDPDGQQAVITPYGPIMLPPPIKPVTPSPNPTTIGPKITSSLPNLPPAFENPNKLIHSMEETAKSAFILILTVTKIGADKFLTLPAPSLPNNLVNEPPNELSNPYKFEASSDSYGGEKLIKSLGMESVLRPNIESNPDFEKDLTKIISDKISAHYASLSIDYPTHERNKQIYLEYYGLGAPQLTPSQIAKKYDISRERVNQIINNIDLKFTKTEYKKSKLKEDIYYGTLPE